MMGDESAAQGTVLIRDALPDEREAIRDLTLRAYAEYGRTMEPGAWAALSGAVTSGLGADDRAERIVAVQPFRTAVRPGARARDHLLGSVMLYPAHVDAYGLGVHPAPGPELRLLAVAPEARGLGVGRRLVEECIRRARAAGAPELGLHTSASMTAALRLYEEMGFERVPRRDFHPDGAELVMAYRLVL